MNFKSVFVLSCIIFSTCTEPRSTIDQLKAEADTLNAHCPQKLDSETELYNVNWSEPYFKYTFRLVNLDKPLSDTIAFKSLLMPGITSEIHLRNDSVACRTRNVIFIYTYFDKQMHYICSVKVPYLKVLP